MSSFGLFFTPSASQVTTGSMSRSAGFSRAGGALALGLALFSLGVMPQASAGAASGRDVNGQQVERGVRDEALKVVLTLDKSRYAASENPLATVTFTNTSNQTLRLLNWYLPATELEEDLFRVDTLTGAGPEPVAYLGAHYKRPAPTDNNFVRLNPGQSLTRTVDLAQWYDLSDSGDYRFQFEVEALQLQGIQAGMGRIITSNEVKVSIEGRTVTPPWAAEGDANVAQANNAVQAGSVSYTKCNSTDSATAGQAAAAANTYSDTAVTYLSGTPTATTRYTTWFGAFSTSGWNTAKTHFVAIQDAFDNKNIVIDCGCRKNYYAYVYPDQPYKIYVCRAFWSAPMTGTDSKAGTLIHEMSHFNVVAGTDDWAYGQTDAKNLAKTNPTKALDNADNHEYFAENNPNLP